MTKRPRRHRVFRLLAALCVAGSVAVGASALPAGGQTDEEALFPESYLVQYGWWNKAQQTPDGGTAVPKPPNAPDNGIYIAYEAIAGTAPSAVTGPISGGVLPDAPVDDGSDTSPEQQVLAPTAYGAVRFEAPEGAEGILTLNITARSSSTPGGVDPQVGAVMACVATSPWDPVQNGRFEGAPSYDCGAAASGFVAGDQVVFDVPVHLQQGRTLDLVIVPVGNEPFTMSFNAPTDDSYIITNADELLPEAEEEFTPEDSPVFDSGATFVPPQESYDFGSTFVAEPAPTTVQEVTPRPQAELTQPVRNPLRPDASRVEQIAAVAVLLLLAAGLWWFGGKEARPPRLLGSLGKREAALVPVGQAPRAAALGGIGRFARPRLGPAPRL